MLASDLAILDRLTRHAEETILEAARHTAHCAPADGRPVEDELAELRALARHLSARPAAT